MEIKVDVSGLRSCEKQLEICESLLDKRQKECLEIMAKLRRMESMEAITLLCKKLAQQAEELQVQCRQLSELHKVMHKVLRVYEKCENEILMTNETCSRQYVEKPRTVHLQKNQEFQIVLK